jgi:Domain of unknown function (DUF4350)
MSETRIAPAVASEAQARALARPTWLRLRFWFVLAVVVAVGALAIAAVAVSVSSPAGDLDPTSPAHGGSKALARLLEQRGTSVTKLSDPAQARDRPSSTTVLVVDPDDLGADQLQALSGHRVVLIQPDVSSLATFTSTVEADSVLDSGSIQPGCSWPGAQSAGAVTFPGGTDSYTGPSTCYDGAVVVTDRLVVLGSGALLRNDRLAGSSVAALDINAISADGAVTDVAWLMPGVSDTGSGSPSVWALFPPWAQRAFWWLLVVGVLAALWRGRRLGPVVYEPLPVVVRSAEVVEGHGRLYRRAEARGRAAALLRAGSAHRLARHLGLERRASAAEVVAVLPAAGALTGGEPLDDDGLLRLANDLTALEAGTVRSGPGAARPGVGEG